MKKIQLLLVAFLFGTIFVTACGRTDSIHIDTPEDGKKAAAESEASKAPDAEQPGTVQEGLADAAFLAEERLVTRQRELYDKSIKSLDDMLAENRGREIDDVFYQENIGTIYIFSEAYKGVLQAGYDEAGIHVFQIGITNEYLEEKQKYECRLLADDSLWFTYQTESVCERDMPDYIVNEDVLRYSRVDYIYDDGQTDVEEEREIRRQKADEYLAEETGGEMQEFWLRGDLLYRIDRAEGVFIDVTEDKEICIADFLREQLRRIPCQLSVSEASLEAVEKYKPKGYSLLHGKNAWDEIAASDLNHDGRVDYVAVLYPNDYEEVQRYADWSPYEHSSQYYAASFWLLLSSEDGGYEQISLSDSIEYWETALVLTEVAFVEENILQLEYFVGRSPFTNALLRFQYEEEEKDFYILSSYYRDSFNDSLLIGGVENYGRISMQWYFSGFGLNYCEGNWRSVSDVFMQDGTYLDYYSDSFQYACENLLEEHHINSLIWEKEYELFRTLKEHSPDVESDASMDADPVFYNSRLASGQVELYYLEERDGSRSFRRITMPIMVDKQSGAYVKVTGLLQKEAFLQIFADWSEDALRHGYITEEKKERCRNAIEKGWEKADTPENFFGEKDEYVTFQIMQEGIRMGVKLEEEKWEEHYMIEKEYFWGTKAWEYLRIYEEERIED